VYPDAPYFGLLDGLTFSGCTFGGSTAIVTAQNLPWTLSRTGPNAAGVAPVRLAGVKIMVHIPSIPCSVTLQGSTATNGFIDGTHTNPTSAGSPSTLSLPITATNNLVATSVSATCASNIIKNGDTVVIGAAVIKLRGVNSTANEGLTLT